MLGKVLRRFLAYLVAVKLNDINQRMKKKHFTKITDINLNHDEPMINIFEINPTSTKYNRYQTLT